LTAEKRPLRIYLLPLACGLGAVMLAASSFMVRFRIDVEGTIVQHVRWGGLLTVSLLVLACFAFVAILAAIATGSRPAALAVAAAGATALVIVLVVELPDVNQRGTLETFVTGKAEPGPGFWFELAGALVLAACGAAFASLPEQALDRLSRKREREELSEPEPVGPGRDPELDERERVRRS
jgi:hypothetical protein